MTDIRIPSKVILICPCCASPVDATDTDGLEAEHECHGCGQRWLMVVDADRHAEHAL